MGCRVFVGHEAGSEIERAFLYCSTTELCFGPAFRDEEECTAFLDAFLEACDVDPRRLSPAELDRAIELWRLHVKHEARGEAACDVCAQYWPAGELADHDGNMLCRECGEAWENP